VVLDLAVEAATPAERQEQRDARPALAERYRSHADYVARVARAVQQLMEQRLLLPEDADRYIEAAMHTDVRSWQSPNTSYIE
jgi:Alpha/beta hydrolase domain